MADVEKITCDGEVIAIIIPHDFSSGGTHFFTPPEYSQQLAFIRHDAGDRIQEHIHKLNKRVVTSTQEVLFIKKGSVKVSLFDKKRRFVCDKILSTGDAILLVGAGHGFEFIEDTELIEIKQGPYSKEDDKIRFEGV